MAKPQFNFECKVVVHTANANLTYQYGKMANAIEIHFNVPFSQETEKHITEVELLTSILITLISSNLETRQNYMPVIKGCRIVG